MPPSRRRRRRKTDSTRRGWADAGSRWHTTARRSGRQVSLSLKWWVLGSMIVVRAPRLVAQRLGEHADERLLDDDHRASLEFGRRRQRAPRSLRLDNCAAQDLLNQTQAIENQERSRHIQRVCHRLHSSFAKTFCMQLRSAPTYEWPQCCAGRRHHTGRRTMYNSRRTCQLRRRGP